jgi:response regulator NasT
LIILDVMMPAGDGFSVMERLRMSARTIGTPVIILTALTKQEIEERAKKLGAIAVLHKPYTTQDLIGAVEAALGKPGA